ncbi:hypothetical protein L6164_023574 [Bauhinia variegata]|uniref:Uncharacterized protein n=1 Tax=Bauhinia variegata TaxID=167791 RepID=A0ACB9MIZ3_BAUVA|nr:hypothetical protein L6164_023574 [Bauhinia variegata]
MEDAEEMEIVIVGGGICGLGTALALHRKGIRSVVLERSEHLRATGGGLGILANGWRALDQLGVGLQLRQTALAFHRGQDLSLDTGKQQEITFWYGEARCLRRGDLISTLAESLPAGTLRLGCQVLSIQLDPATSFPVLHLHNGQIIKAKVLIGCDGAHSVVADFIGLKPPSLFAIRALRGITSYPNGHEFPIEFLRIRGKKGILGMIPIDSKEVYWFLLLNGTSLDSNASKDPKFMQQLALESTEGFPSEMLDMIKNSDHNSLSLTQLRYRAPWDILHGNFCRGAITVAGDAMHLMGPFLGQGGSAGLEDAIVLARCLTKKLNEVNPTSGQQLFVKEIGQAIDSYVKERRMRLAELSFRSYIVGSLFENPIVVKKFVFVVVMKLFFPDPANHTRYDCGSL